MLRRAGYPISDQSDARRPGVDDVSMSHVLDIGDPFAVGQFSEQKAACQSDVGSGVERHDMQSDARQDGEFHQPTKLSVQYRRSADRTA